MNPVRRVTARGWVTLAAAGVMALAAFLFGIQELYSLAAAATALVLAARAWVGIRRWELGVARHVHPLRVPAGSDARVELTFTNDGRSRTPVLSAADPFDGGRRWARFAIAPMAPGETRKASYRLPTSRRGVYHLGPLELEISDPFGMAEAVTKVAPDTSLIVHPRVESLSTRSPSSHRDDDRLPLPVLGRDSDELYALREYVPGDDLRHVHWPSTARLDDLVVRQPEHLRRGRVTVVADLREPLHDADTVETVLSAVASVAVSSLRAGLQVRVVTTGGLDTGHGSGRNHTPAVLDGLAAASPHANSGGQNPFRVVRTVGPVVVVTTDLASERDVESAFAVGGPNGTTVVIFESQAGAGVGGGRSGRRAAVRVPRGGSFQTAWEVAMC